MGGKKDPSSASVRNAEQEQHIEFKNPPKTTQLSGPRAPGGTNHVPIPVQSATLSFFSLGFGISESKFEARSFPWFFWCFLCFFFQGFFWVRQWQKILCEFESFFHKIKTFRGATEQSQRDLHLRPTPLRTPSAGPDLDPTLT